MATQNELVNAIHNFIQSNQEILEATDASARREMHASGRFTEEEVATCTDESREGTPVYETFYATQTSHIRRLLTSAASQY